VTYDDLIRAAAKGGFEPFYRRFLFGSVGEYLADRFGTKGSPVATSTACASGGTAIQLGVEAIRRGETDAALVVGTLQCGELDPVLPAIGIIYPQRSPGFGVPAL
jgi:3-oxoacyl-[acyl-carrier-protein] synthase II